MGLPFLRMGPLLPFILAQKDRLRGPPPGWGAFRFEPVSRLYFSRPAFVKPPDRDLCFPIRKLTDFFRTFATTFTFGSFGVCHYFFLVMFLVTALRTAGGTPFAFIFAAAFLTAGFLAAGFFLPPCP